MKISIHYTNTTNDQTNRTYFEHEFREASLCFDLETFKTAVKAAAHSIVCIAKIGNQSEADYICELVQTLPADTVKMYLRFYTPTSINQSSSRMKPSIDLDIYPWTLFFGVGRMYPPIVRRQIILDVHLGPFASGSRAPELFVDPAVIRMIHRVETIDDATWTRIRDIRREVKAWCETISDAGLRNDYIMYVNRYFRFVCCTCEQTHMKTKKCSRCQAVYYCSRECQRRDWPTHKSICKPVNQ